MSFNEIICRIITEAVLPGVSSVLSFIPAIALLIAILTLLKESGIVRSDSALYLMGFSCSVPAILACSTIPCKRRRYLTMLTIPYMSCSAKLPVYVMLASVFFPAFPIAAIGSIYLIGVLTAVLTILTAKGTKLFPKGTFSESTQPLVPRPGPISDRTFAPKKPSPRIVFDAVKDACLGFVKKAFTIILASSVVIWLLQNLDTSIQFTDNIESSLLAHIGIFFEPFFRPLGFGDRRAAAALLCGIASKESVVSTFAVMAGSFEESALWTMLTDIFTPASAFSFMVFCLLYTPCVGTLAAVRNVTDSKSMPLLIFIGQTAVAWSVSFLIFHSIKVII